MTAIATDTPTILIIDDEMGILDTIRILLKSEGFIPYTALGGKKGLEQIAALKPDLILTDVRMPDISGIELLRRLRELKVAVPVIVITAHGDIPLAVEAMRIGAIDFLEKPFEDEVLLASVRSALDRGDRDQKRQAERSRIEGRLAALSNRERDVLRGLVTGHANKQIAYDLGISARTIENYRANLMIKMQAASLSDLVRMALIAGVLDPSADDARAD